ncbi:hypothetical protein D3C71_2152200 [compost metagenome]
MILINNDRSGLLALASTQADVRQAGVEFAQVIDDRVHAQAEQLQGRLATFEFAFLLAQGMPFVRCQPAQ